MMMVYSDFVTLGLEINTFTFIDRVVVMYGYVT